MPGMQGHTLQALVLIVLGRINVRNGTAVQTLSPSGHSAIEGTVITQGGWRQGPLKER
jgi:hypothetical protein